MSFKEPLDDKTHKDLHLIYTISIDDIRLAKQQQWKITYYAIITMSGIAFFMLKYRLPSDLGRLLIALLAICALSMLIAIQIDIIGYRKRIVNTRDFLSEKFKSISGISSDYPKWNYKIGYLLILISTIIAAGFLSCLFP